MKYIILIGLFFYGLFYHISSSEFWPVTISKTWLTPATFEYSQLQKPLLTFFLATLHLFNLSDADHLYVTKAFFSAFGILALWIFTKIVRKIAPEFKSPWLILFFLVAASPVILNNFFRIRSDQLAFLFFGLFLLFTEKNKPIAAALTLFLIPLTGIKEVIFLVPGIFIFLTNFKVLLSRKQLYYLSAVLLCIVVWALALNVSSFTYLMQTWNSAVFPNGLLLNYLWFETPLLVLSLASAVYIYVKRLRPFYIYAFCSFYFSFLLFLIPQSYPFYIASLAPFIYLSLFAALGKLKSKMRISILSTLVLLIATEMLVFKVPIYKSNLSQFSFIQAADQLLASKSMTYLDGMGILPKQPFIPCFVSPNDEAANNFCLQSLNEHYADVVIVTQRLSFLGSDIFVPLRKDYEQVLPNLWIKKTLVQAQNIRPDLNNQALPIFIFGFD